MKRDCPNRKRVMLTHDGYVSASDDEKADAPSSVEFEENTEVIVDGYELATNLKNIMVQRVLEDRIHDQGHHCNIFQTQCIVNDTTCKLIIVSKSLVDSLSLPTWKHLDEDTIMDHADFDCLSWKEILSLIDDYYKVNSFLVERMS
jgi:hypothetical protein